MPLRLPILLCFGRKGFSILLFLVFSTAAVAQLSQYKYTTYTTDNELPDNGVMQMAQDKAGNLWIATRNGLSRYDGTTFKNYHHRASDSGSLRSNWITDLATDADGTLWVSTEWGLCYYNPAKDNFTYIHPASSFAILYKAPLLYTGGNTLWMATGSGLKKIDTYRKTWQSTSLVNIPDPQSICADAKGRIWVSTRGSGMYVYDTRTNKSEQIYLPQLSTDADIMDLWCEADVIWAATSDGLLVINDATRQASLYNKIAGKPRAVCDKLMCIAGFTPLTGDSLLLCGTYDKKLLLFSKRRHLFIDELTNLNNKLFNIPAAIFNSFCVTGATLWIGTDAGLCKLNLNQQQLNTYSLPTADGSAGKLLTTNLVTDNTNEQTRWLLTNHPCQLIKYDLLSNKVVTRVNIAGGDNDAVGLVHTGGNHLWVVQKQGVAHYNTQGKLLSRFRCPKTIMSANYDAQQTIWLGTESGIASFNTTTGKFQAYDCHFTGAEIENQSSPIPFPVQSLVPDNQGHIWLACIKYGLFAFDVASRKFTPYRQPFQAIYETKNRCSSVSFGADGLLWVGNMAGISSFDTASQRFTNYNRDSGLLSTYVYSINSRQGYLWGRGNAGVFCYQPATRKFTNYQLPVAFSTDMIFQKISVENNQAFMGFQGGLARFSLLSSTAVLPLTVHINGVSVLNQRVPVMPDAPEPLQLTHDQNVVAIEYGTSNFDDLPIAYEYRMEGMYNTWMDAGKQRTVLFPALHPGRYVFEVRCKQADNNISAPITTFAFTIRPPFWKTPLFLVSIGLLLLLLIALIIYRQFRKVKQREKENIARVQEHADLEMKALRSQMNPHFIFNALNSIHRYILGNRQEAASEYLIKFSKLMRQVLENSQQKLISIEEELQALSLYIELEHRRTADKFDYTITVADEVNKAGWMIPPLLLQPYVENAIWHGLNEKEGRGLLAIHIYTAENRLCCSIDDDGVGREATGGRQKMLFKKISLGSNISSARIRWLRDYNGNTATVQIIDKKDDKGKPQGTTVLLALPILTGEKEDATNGL